MGFLSPHVPDPPKPPNPAINPTPPPSSLMSQVGNLSPLTSSPAGLLRKNNLNKVSLIGGG